MEVSSTNRNNNDHLDIEFPNPITRDIHALTPPRVPHREAWETSGHNSSSLSMASSENFTSMSREFSALVVAGSTVGTVGTEHDSSLSNLERIREDESMYEETNHLAIVPDINPFDHVPLPSGRGISSRGGGYVNINGVVSIQQVKKEEVESRINAWQNAKVAKVNNRFKREDVVINGWESEQSQKASSWMKNVERKLEEKRAKAQEKMQNDIAKAHKKAEERRASSEAKRGTKVARILEIANVMRAIGQPPSKRSLF